MTDVFPPNKGQYEVGCTDFMTPSDFKPSSEAHQSLKGLEDNEIKDVPGYFMKLYYPTRKNIGNEYDYAKWIPKGIYADGYLTVMHLPVFLLGRIGRWIMGYARIRAYEDAPILKQEEKFPVVIFSHGLGANRTCYSSLCTDLASKGFFVAAVEHRDRSACATYYIDKNKDEVDVPFRKFIKGEDEYILRNVQVRQRAFETSMALTIISMLNQTDPSFNIKNEVDSKFDAKSLQGSLNLNKVAVAGHSFGGCTAIKTLAQDKRFKCGFVLDAWMFPLEDTVYGNVEQPVLFVNSESFHWKANIRSIRRIIGNDDDKKMLTLKGTGHHSQCDIPSVIPSWILGVFRMSAKMDNDQAIGIQRKLMTTHLKKYLDTDIHEEDSSNDFEVSDVILEGTNIELPEEEQESWYHQS